MDYEYYMRQAILLAEKAFSEDETPIGALIVYEGEIIGRGYNRRNSLKNVLCHAEIIAINEACKFVGDWRLENAVIFSTVEPCPMCAGAILQSRIKESVFGCKNAKFGCCGSVLNILEEPRFNHQVNIVSGILEEECVSLMQSFFKKRR